MSRLPALLVVVLVAMASGLAAAPAPAVLSQYDDIAEAGEHTAATQALAEVGVFIGTECAVGKFCPTDPIPRWVMAVWMVRLVFGREPPPADPPTFADVEGDAWWASYVDKLAELEITKGCYRSPALFCPHRSVTRAEMASFLTRAFDLAPAEPSGFTDTVGNPHADSIDALAAANITAGCSANPARYCPDRPVTRAEMATFLARAVNLVPRAAPVGVPELEWQGDLHLVAQFTTYHHCCSPRVTNIHLFADLVDGAVVKPGQRFSLNRRVGKRTPEKGFLEARTLVNGTLVDGVGGGVSQFVTTLYNAVFWGGYEDVFHWPHSGYFPRYPEGIEATINWPDIDLIFRNDSSADVLIRAEYTDTSLTVKLFGQNEGRSVVGDWKDGVGHMEVPFEGGPGARVVTADVSERLDVVEPPGTRFVADPELAPGEQEYVQTAQAGWTTLVTRTIRQAGRKPPRRGGSGTNPGRRSSRSTRACWQAPVGNPGVDRSPHQVQDTRKTLVARPRGSPRSGYGDGPYWVSRTITGISRVVFSSYSAKNGYSLFCRLQIRSRSVPSVTRARAGMICPPSSTPTSGLASRL